MSNLCLDPLERLELETYVWTSVDHGSAVQVALLIIGNISGEFTRPVWVPQRRSAMPQEWSSSAFRACGDSRLCVRLDLNPMGFLRCWAERITGLGDPP